MATCATVTTETIYEIIEHLSRFIFDCDMLIHQHELLSEQYQAILKPWPVVETTDKPIEEKPAENVKLQEVELVEKILRKAEKLKNSKTFEKVLDSKNDSCSIDRISSNADSYSQKDDQFKNPTSETSTCKTLRIDSVNQKDVRSSKFSENIDESSCNSAGFISKSDCNKVINLCKQNIQNSPSISSKQLSKEKTVAGKCKTPSKTISQKTKHTLKLNVSKSSSYKPAHAKAPFGTFREQAKSRKSYHEKNVAKSTKNVSSCSMSMASGVESINGKGCSNVIGSFDLNDLEFQSQDKKEIISSETENNSKEVTHFEILKHGHCIHVPSQIKKVYLKNYKLRKKMICSQMTHQVKEKKDVSPSESFSLKLEAHIYNRNEQNTSYLKVVELLQIYLQLMGLIHSLANTSSSATVNGEYGSKVKKVLQYVRVNYLKLEDEYTTLLGYLKENSGASPIRNTIPWNNLLPLGEDIFSQSYIKMPYERWKNIVYENSEELDDYNELIHKEYALVLRNKIVTLITEKLFPLMKQSNLPQSSRIALFRTLHYYLSSSETAIPVMVADEGED